MSCSKCGFENRDTAKFCSECGAPLSLTCPNGHTVAPGARFCDECGTQVNSGSALGASASPAQVPSTSSAGGPAEDHAPERRLVSVLFADLVGFTSISETTDAEEVRDLLSRYFETCRQLIARYGGIVEKFIGDAVMAVWGTPVAREDDAERAVRAALDLTAAVAALGQEIGVPGLAARAGVMTGEAAVMMRFEEEGMVAGDLVNTASRVQSIAPPGSVFVGEKARRATEAAIVYEDAGTHTLKGKAEPIALWRAARVVAGVGGAYKTSGLEPPFVGRDREFRLVKDLFHATAEEGRAHLVSVLGIGGIGKSRLAWEFFKYIEGLVDTTNWHRGRCLSYGEGVTYWALAEMVRMRARIAEGEDAASAAQKLRATCEEYLPDDQERRWVEPRLAHLLGLEEREAPDPEDLFAAWRVFFERVAEEHPTVLIFEDMHWADASLVEFIEYLMNWSRNSPLFVVTLARPEMMERYPSWGAGRRAFTSLSLEPLGPAAMGQMLEGLVPGLPTDLAERILARSEGVPLYAVETVRMLLDRGVLESDGPAFRITGPIDSLEVPESLHALVAARLDGLTEAERRLVQSASVLGKTFTLPAAAALSGASATQTTELLEALVRKEVLGVQADPRSPESGQYGFLQDLVRRIAYDTMSKKDRRAKHLAAAAYIESAWANDVDEIVEVLVSHYLQAYEATPDPVEAAPIKAKALEYLVRAGKRAASLAAREEAKRYLERAIELTDDEVARAELHEFAGETTWTGGYSEETAAHFETAIDTFERHEMTHAAARVSAAYAEVIRERGDIAGALQRLGQAFDVLAGEEPDEDIATLAAQYGRLLFFVGRAGEAHERLEFALQIAETLQLPRVYSEALNTKSLTLEAAGRWDESLLLVQHAKDVALENDLPREGLRAMNNIGALMNSRRRHQDELNVIEQGLALARKVGDQLWERQLMGGSLSPRVQLGLWDEALDRWRDIRALDDLERQSLIVEVSGLMPALVNRGELDEARTLWGIVGGGVGSEDVQTRASVQLAHAQLLWAEGDDARALEEAEGAFGMRDELGLMSMVQDGLWHALESAFALGKFEKVGEFLSFVDMLKPGERSPYFEAMGDRFSARLDASRGEEGRVDARYRRAAELLDALPLPFPRAVTQLEHSEWLAGRGHADDAAEIRAQAVATFEQLKAVPWLARARPSPGVIDITEATVS